MYRVPPNINSRFSFDVIRLAQYAASSISLSLLDRFQIFVAIGEQLSLFLIAHRAFETSILPSSSTHLAFRHSVLIWNRQFDSSKTGL